MFPNGIHHLETYLVYVYLIFGICIPYIWKHIRYTYTIWKQMGNFPIWYMFPLSEYRGKKKWEHTPFGNI